MDNTVTSNPIIKRLDCDCPETRSLLAIIWSCLATLFACTWVSIHPNVPAANDPFWVIMLRRLRTMAFNLLAPDFTLFWAYRQWAGARAIRNKFKDRGWTMTHAYFIEMGGFMLYDDKKTLGVLTSDRLEQLLREDRVAFPSLTLKDIEDRSKADALAKTVVVVQTSWFLAQTITRLVLHLTITHLEYYTLLFTLFNAIFYYLWWYKPLNVELTVAVYLKPPLAEKTSASIASSHDDSETIYWSVENFEPISGSEGPTSDIVQVSRASSTPPYKFRDHPNGDNPEDQDSTTSAPSPEIRFLHRFSIDKVIHHYFPQIPPIEDPEPIETTHINSPSGPLHRLGAILEIITLGITTVPPNSPRVHSYYAPPVPPHGFKAIGLLSLLIFLLYSPYFIAPVLLQPVVSSLSGTEIAIWLVAGFCSLGWAFIITCFHFAVPRLTGVTARRLWDMPGELGASWTVKWFVHLLTVGYLLTRAALVFVACFSLRRVSDEALRDVDWSDFVPHVG